MLDDIQETHIDINDKMLTTCPNVIYSFGTLPSRRASNGVPTIADEEGGSSYYDDATKAPPNPKPTAVSDSDREINRPEGEWPQHWIDPVHESDGGCDVIGENPQDGREMLRGLLAKLSNKGGYDTASDDVSNEDLDPKKVREARAVEIKFFEKMQVYERVPRSHAEKTGGKVIGVRWVDVNKGNRTTTDYRSRLVGQ